MSEKEKMSVEFPFDAQGHRGGRDARPENTLYSYAYAIENGCTTIECDMQFTADGEIVMLHNPALPAEYTRDENGNYVEQDALFISKMTLEEVKKYNIGFLDPNTSYYAAHGTTQVMCDAQVPTLRELLQLVKDSGSRIQVSAEIKAYPDPAAGLLYENNMDTEGCLQAFNALAKEFDMEDQLILQSFDWATLSRMKQINPKIRLSALYIQKGPWASATANTLWAYRDQPSPWLGGLDIKDFEGNPVAAAHSLGFQILSPYYEEISKGQVNEAHKYGMQVIVWTVNDPVDMEMMYAMGVDGMISDRPWVMREFLESKAVPLPPKCKLDSKYHLEPEYRQAEKK